MDRYARLRPYPCLDRDAQGLSLLANFHVKRNAETMRSCTLVLAAIGMLAGCAGQPPWEASRRPSNLDFALAEEPPCHLPPLSDAEVHDAVARVSEPDPAFKGLPPPNWKVTERKCIYFYEESALYYNGKPASVDSVDCCLVFAVSRDGKIIQ